MPHKGHAPPCPASTSWSALLATVVLLFVSAGAPPPPVPAADPEAPAPAAAPKPLTLAQRQAQVASGKFALVVGIDHYASPDIAQLHFSEADARAVADELVRYCGFPADHVDLLLGAAATEEAILTRLDALSNAQLYGGGDTLLVYFSGHGAVFDGRGSGVNAAGIRDNYVLPYDGSVNPAMVQLRNIPLDTVQLMLDRSVFARKIVLLDACRSELRLGARGAAPGFDQTSWADRYSAAQGLKLIVSTQNGEVSWEDPSLGHGIFTYYLLQGLQGQAADDQGVVTIGRLAEFIERGMTTYSRKNPQRVQLPTMLGEGMVNIPLAVVNLAAPPAVTALATSHAPLRLGVLQDSFATNTVPDFALQDLDGTPQVFSSLFKDSRYLLLDFWISDCPPCDEQVPHVLELVRTHPDLGVVFVARNQDWTDLHGILHVTTNRVSSYFRSRPDLQAFPVLLDSKHLVGDVLGVKGAPDIYLLDRERNVLFRAQGFRELEPDGPLGGDTLRAAVDRAFDQ